MSKLVIVGLVAALILPLKGTAFGADDSPAQKPTPDQISGLFTGNLVADGTNPNELRIRANAGGAWTIRIPYSNVSACRSEFPLRLDSTSDGKIYVSRGEGVLRGCERTITLTEVTPSSLRGEMAGVIGITTFKFLLKKVSE